MKVNQPTVQEVGAMAVGMAVVAIMGALLLTGHAVPGELWAVVTSAVGYILGSRSSQP